jgi:hypothetical protein
MKKAAKCSYILKDPFNPSKKNIFYKIWYTGYNFCQLRNFENYFLDFQEIFFDKQAKDIFDKVSLSVKEGHLGQARKFLNDEIISTFSDEDTGNNLEENKKEELLKLLPTQTSNWEIVHARTLYLDDILEPLSNTYAQITMKYSTPEKKENYVVFERNCMNNLSYHSWKIFVLNYQYFK